MNKITINFTTCSPAPSGGYKIYYRVEGTSDSYTFAGTFYATPAVFYDTVNPPGTCYEGYIVTDCGNGVLGNQVPFSTCDSAIISHDITFSDISNCTPGLPFTTFRVNGTPGDVIESVLSVNGSIDYSIASSHSTVFVIAWINTPANDGSSNVDHTWTVGVDLTGNTFFGFGSPVPFAFTIPISGHVDFQTRVNLENGGTNVNGFFSITKVNGEDVSHGTAVCAGFSTGA